MTALPLSVRAALWATAVLSGLVDARHGHSRAHAGVTDVTGPWPASPQWPAPGERLVLVALPRPGSFSGMPRAGRPGLGAALDAGECLVAPTVGGLLVPRVETFGPVGDQGRLLTWTAYDAEPIPGHRLEAHDLRELSHQLTAAVRTATTTLERVGGIPWRAWESTAAPVDAADAILPLGLPPRALRLIGQAAAVHTLAADGLAMEQARPAFDAATSQARARALRTLAETADEALAGATNAGALALAGRLG